MRPTKVGEPRNGSIVGISLREMNHLAERDAYDKSAKMTFVGYVNISGKVKTRQNQLLRNFSGRKCENQMKK